MSEFLRPPPPAPFAVEGECKRGEVGSPLKEQKHALGLEVVKDGEGASSFGEENGFGEGEGSESSGGRTAHHGGRKRVCLRGHWKPQEDAKLRELVAVNGPHNWNLIAQKIDGRTGKSCRLRWCNQLDPRINKRAFSQEEEEKLLAARNLYGNRWSMISKLFPGKTDNAVKNHWHVVVSRRQRAQGGGCKRRRSSATPCTRVLPKGMEMSTGNNACSGESSITSHRDESTATSTGLSLKSTLSRVDPAISKTFSPPQQPQLFEFLRGSGEKLIAVGDRACEKIGDHGTGSQFVALMMSATGIDQHGYFDATSEISATESVANHKNSGSLHGETDNDGERIDVPFIDFLGVGAT